MTLVDQETGTVYVPMSDTIAEELAEWSKPCQIRLENGHLVVRTMAQPVKGVYVTREEMSVTEEAFS